MKAATLVSVFFLWGLNVNAYTQGSCPSGSYPIGGQGVQGCAPMPGPQQRNTPVVPELKWEDRFGAIAVDWPKGALGTSSNMSSRSLAEKNAISDCRARGGSNCKLETWYGNQCTAFVSDDFGYTIRNRNTADRAAQDALKTCNDSDAKNCRVYYADCSLAVRVQ